MNLLDEAADVVARVFVLISPEVRSDEEITCYISLLKFQIGLPYR